MTLLRRFEHIQLVPQDLVWRTNLGLRGLTSLKVNFEVPDRLSRAPRRRKNPTMSAGRQNFSSGPRNSAG